MRDRRDRGRKGRKRAVIVYSATTQTEEASLSAGAPQAPLAGGQEAQAPSASVELRRLAEALGLSESNLSTMFGVSPDVVKRWLTVSSPPVSVRRALENRMRSKIKKV